MNTNTTKPAPESSNSPKEPQNFHPSPHFRPHHYPLYGAGIDHAPLPPPMYAVFGPPHHGPTPCSSSGWSDSFPERPGHPHHHHGPCHRGGPGPDLMDEQSSRPHHRGLPENYEDSECPPTYDMCTDSECEDDSDTMRTPEADSVNLDLTAPDGEHSGEPPAEDRPSNRCGGRGGRGGGRGHHGRHGFGSPEGPGGDFLAFGRDHHGHGPHGHGPHGKFGMRSGDEDMRSFSHHGRRGRHGRHGKHGPHGGPGAFGAGGPGGSFGPCASRGSGPEGFFGFGKISKAFGKHGKHDKHHHGKFGKCGRHGPPPFGHFGFPGPYMGGEDVVVPPMDIFQTESAYVLYVALPSGTRESVTVLWDEDRSSLLISTTIERMEEADGVKLLVSERRVGKVERRVVLPPVEAFIMKVKECGKGKETEDDIDMEAEKKKDRLAVDGTGIEARMQDGILVVTVPIFEKEWMEARKIDIQ